MASTFVACLILFTTVFQHIHIVSQYLQSPNIELSRAAYLASGLIETLSALRCEDQCTEMFQKVESLRVEHGIEQKKIQRPRSTRKRQMPAKLSGFCS